MKKLMMTMIMAALLTACSSSEKKTEAASNENVPPVAEENAIDSATLAKLLQPEDLNETAPALCVVTFKTTKGDFDIELHRDWAPQGVDRFYNLVKAGFFSDIAFFRMVRGFVIQFGIHGLPIVSEVWREARISDDPVTQTNARGTVTFATAGPDTRTTQLFINIADNTRLDGMGFAPIGKIISGMDVVDALNFEYAERPDQMRIQMKGNEYLKASFPNLDYILSAEVKNEQIPTRAQ